ncbi:hypothetical protein VB636_07325 [Paracoccus sp. APAP_BH8]
MAHAPEALLGEGRRGRQDQLAPLLGQRGRAFRDLGLAADIEADLGEGQPEGLHPVPFRGGPGRLGREDMGLGVHEMLAIRAEQMGDVLIPVRRDLLEIRAGADEQATPLRLRPEEVATGLRMLGDLHQLGDGALAPIRQGGEQFDGEKLGKMAMSEPSAWSRSACTRVAISLKLPISRTRYWPPIRLPHAA